MDRMRHIGLTLGLVLCLVSSAWAVPRQHRRRIGPHFALATLVSQAGGVLALDASDTLTITTDGAASFVAASSQFLSIADNPDLSTGDVDWTWIGWVFLDANLTNLGIAGKLTTTNADKEYQLFYDGITDNRFEADFFIDAVGGSRKMNASTFGAAPLNTWLMVHLQFNAVANEGGISVNGGMIDVTSVPSVNDGAAPFEIGRSVATPVFWDGRIAQVAFFKKILSPTEITFLFNAGKGRQCIEHAAMAGLLTNEVACWNLMEQGLRLDSVGANDLAATNSPGTAPGPDPLRVLDGAPVINWADTSGNGNDVSQAGALIKPVWVQDCQNGRGCVRFDGVDDSLSGTSPTPVSVSMFAVTANVISASTNHVGGRGSTGFSGFLWRYSSTSALWRIGNGTTFQQQTFPNVSFADAVLLTGTYQTLDQFAQVNGANDQQVAVLSGAIDYTGQPAYFVGQDVAQIVNRSLDGDTLAHLMFPLVVDNVTRARINQCLMQQWGIAPQTGFCR